MLVQSYLFLNGRCEEALNFYKQALGAEVNLLMRFKDSPEPKMCPTGSDDMIMHASFRIGETTLMASDGRGEGKAKFEGIALSIAVKTVEESQRFFTALSEGGAVQMPLMETFYSPSFGMVSDKFGVWWMIMTEPSSA